MIPLSRDEIQGGNLEKSLGLNESLDNSEETKMLAR